MRGWGTKSRLLPWARAGMRNSLQRRRVVRALPYATMKQIDDLRAQFISILDPFWELMLSHSIC